MSPEVQNRGLSGLTKGQYPPKIPHKHNVSLPGSLCHNRSVTMILTVDKYPVHGDAYQESLWRAKKLGRRVKNMKSKATCGDHLFHDLF